MIYAGFDRAECFLLDDMALLRRESNLDWCGYYLHAPSQSGKGWTGKRAALVAQGWGLAPIFVGQQIQGPGSKIVTATQGAEDGRKACEAMKFEGFPSGSWVYLDLENGPPFPQSQRNYVAAWVDAVEAGGFRAGVYCSYLIAPDVAKLRPKARIWVFKIKTTNSHQIYGKEFPTPAPSAASPVASIWQHEQNASLAAFGLWPIDLDSSTMRDPGAPEKDAQPKAPPVAPIPDVPAPKPSAPAKGFWNVLMDLLLSLFGKKT